MLRAPAAFLLLTLGSSLVGQTPAVQPQTAITAKTETTNNQNGQEAFVIEQSLTSVSYESDGTGTYENTSRVRLQSQAGVQQWGLLSLGYEKNFQTADFEYVRVRKPDGSVISTSLDGVQDIEAEITRSAPFYSDLREKHIAVKGVAVGDVVEWHTVIHIIKALAPGQFWSSYGFTKNAVILDEQFRLSVPKDRDVRVKSPDLKPKISNDGNRRIYEWQRSQLKREDEDPKVKFGSPFKQPQPDVEISSFKSWDELGRWYGALQQDRVAPTAEVKSKALELTKDAKNDDEKLHILYDYVATHFRYIGVAFGIGRYQPHSAAEVLANSYGDCKDKHTLLASLLQAVGISASPALISSTHDVDPDVPSPAQFDHVITAVHRGKDIVWLDTTSEVAPFGMLLANLREKQVLLIDSDGSALVKTPDKLPVESYDRFQVTGTLSDLGELKASMKDEVRGDGEVLLRSAFHYVAQPQWKELVQRLSYAMGFAGTVSDVTATQPEKTTEPFHFEYSYDRTDFSDWVANKRITVPMPGLGLASLNDEYEKSGQPVRLGTPTQLDYVTELRVPQEYSMEVPTNLDVKTDFAEYHSKYSLTDGTLHAERQLTILAKEVPASEYAKYREFAHKIEDDNGAWVTFNAREKGAASAAPATSNLSWPPPPDSDAGREFKEGISLVFQQHNLEAGLDKLQDAARRDPKIPGVWSAIGTIEMMKRDSNGAVENMRRQTKETPDLPIAFATLAKELLFLDKREEALPILKRWMDIAPDDSDAVTMYTGTLIVTKKYPEAIEMLEKLVKQGPAKDVHYFQLGNAYLESGQPDKAVENYKQAIDLAVGKGSMRNDAAYQLADKSVHLEEAEDWAQQAVQEVENETRHISLQDLEINDLRLMNQLSAYWDTLGWVYFRRGEYSRAESSLSASWWLRQNSVVGEHLAQVYEKLHEPTKASHFHQLARATPDHGGQPLAPGQPPQIISRWKRGEWDAREQLSRMRTIHVSTVSTKSESAEFFVLLDSPAGGAEGTKASTPTSARAIAAISSSTTPRVEGVKFISGSESLKKAEQNLRQANFAIHLPENAAPRLIRRGILMCSPYTHGCDFTLLTVDSVHSVN
jgi:tetratricopeptide (TPR) repeat protein/transglutaminase-like putative cysteine protease